MIDNLEERSARGHQVVREMFGDQWHARYVAAISGNVFGAEAAAAVLKERGETVITANDVEIL